MKTTMVKEVVQTRKDKHYMFSIMWKYEKRRKMTDNDYNCYQWKGEEEMEWGYEGNMINIVYTYRKKA